eukprot:2952758-Prymnesium_polylepis.1
MHDRIGIVRQGASSPAHALQPRSTVKHGQAQACSVKANVNQNETRLETHERRDETIYYMLERLKRSSVG